MRALVLLALVSAAYAASVDFPEDPYPNAQRIVGGSVTSIEQWPMMASMLFSWTVFGHRQTCGGTILNQRSILSAAHCYSGHPNSRWRSRVGSTIANSGGVVLDTEQIIMHPDYYRPVPYENDVAVIRVSGSIVYNNNVQPASIAGANYNLGDNEVVWATGWGRNSSDDPAPAPLLQVQTWTINQLVCRVRYANRFLVVSDNMLCSGWLDVGGRGPCQGDFGGPLFHNGVVVGVSSWGLGCGDSYFPAVSIRVSRLSSWIQSNA